MDCVSTERDQYKKLYRDMLELCRKLERGIVGTKREKVRSTRNGGTDRSPTATLGQSLTSTTASRRSFPIHAVPARFAEDPEVLEQPHVMRRQPYERAHRVPGLQGLRESRDDVILEAIGTPDVHPDLHASLDERELAQ